MLIATAILLLSRVLDCPSEVASTTTIWIALAKLPAWLPPNTRNRETTTAINIPSFLTRKRINITINMDQHGSTCITTAKCQKHRNSDSDQHPFIFNKKTDQHSDQHGSTWINMESDAK
jgi:hypothetical protein